MAKKSKKQKRKKQQRRHHFVEQGSQRSTTSVPTETLSGETNSDSQSATAAEVPAETTPSQTIKPTADKVVDQQLAERIRYMRRDSRLTAIIAGSILVGLVVLWILFDHTGLGPHVYKLIHFN